MNPPQNRFSTHDWTRPTFGGGGEPMPGVNDFREFWADVKTPGTVFDTGNGFAPSAYSVGTIEVRTTAGAFFSDDPAGNPNATASPAGLLPTFIITGPLTPARQVVMLQQAALAGTRLGFQKYYYGTNTGGVLRATHGRGIAVWPAVEAADIRIAICGESQDEFLPQSNVPSGWPGAGGTGTAGFIAMFDGTGLLLWSHHFFGVAANEHCAITDVSVHVEYDNTGAPLTDFVTFCGISTYGMPPANDTLTAVLPFTAPTTCSSSAGGATNNGPGQWDGIVGRLSHPHGSGGAANTQFLSSVGGSQQDGLFGVVDIDAERFAVVGSTGNTGAVTSVFEFPVTFGNCPSSGPPPFSAGVVAVFHGAVGSPLTLEYSQLVGTLATGKNTAVRDVLVQRQWGPAGEPALIVVGATNDAQALGPSSILSLPILAPQAALAGGVDGFVLAGPYTVGATAWHFGTFRGGAGNEGLTGVQGWSEFYDQFSVTGTTAGANSDIDIASYYRTPATAPAGAMLALLTGGAMPPTIGGAQIGGTALDRPTAVAQPVTGPPMMNSTRLGGFAEFELDNPAGGGIAVDPTGRTTVVGTTVSTNFPVSVGRAKTGSTHDAVRIALDMVPRGVGRTDGTGMPVPPSGPPGGYPLPGVFGGTTPECALTPFGQQWNLVDPQVAPAVPRMLIDWEGPPPRAGVSGAVVVSRPPNSSVSLGMALQLAFPGTGAPPGPQPLMPDGVLMWCTDPSAVIITLSPTGFEALRFPLNPMPPGPGIVTVQLICQLGTPVAGGALGPSCPPSGQSGFAASPAMWLNW